MNLSTLPRKLSVIVVTALLSACVTPTKQTDRELPVSRPGSVTENQQSVESAVRKPTPLPDNSPSGDLRQQAVSEIDKGNYPQATRLLERALRVNPRDAANYYQFGRLRLKQQRPNRALQLIDKGLSLQPDKALRAKLLKLKDQAQKNLNNT